MYEQIARNKRRTVAYIVLFFVVILDDQYTSTFLTHCK